MTPIIGIIAGIFTSISLLPQLFKIIRNKKADDVALSMLIILLAGQLLWIVYGVMKDDLPIIITNAFAALMNTIVMVLRIAYGKRSSSK